jgi:Txe/YoeB family toxin of Txe-Axe toxin-antitoxin module
MQLAHGVQARLAPALKRRSTRSGLSRSAAASQRLSGHLTGFWSRRIDQEHRLVYTVRNDELVIVQARYHY